MLFIEALVVFFVECDQVLAVVILGGPLDERIYASRREGTVAITSPTLVCCVAPVPAGRAELFPSFG